MSVGSLDFPDLRIVGSDSATTVAARSLGWAGNTGAIAPGCFADIIAVEGDPLDDISILEDIVFVMKGGEIYKSPE